MIRDVARDCLGLVCVFVGCKWRVVQEEPHGVVRCDRCHDEVDERFKYARQNYGPAAEKARAAGRLPD